MNPLVSVIVTFYNHAPFVAATLDSVFAQTYTNVEVIVVDDGSKDDTAAQCAQYGPRIRFVPRANGGASAARNTGLAEARGVYVAHLDGDDLWHPEKLARQVEAARRFPEAGVIIADGYSFEDGMPDRPGLVGGELGRRLNAAPEPIQRVDCYRTLLHHHCFYSPSQMMVPAAVYQALGGWDERLRVVADIELNLRIAARHPFVLVRGDLVGYRVHSASISGPRQSRKYTWALETFEALRIHHGRADAGARALIAARVAAEARSVARDVYYAGRRGDRGWALGYLRRLVTVTRRPDLVLPFLLGLLLPQRLVTTARRSRRPSSRSGLGRSLGA